VDGVDVGVEDDFRPARNPGGAFGGFTSTGHAGHGGRARVSSSTGGEVSSGVRKTGPRLRVARAEAAAAGLINAEGQGKKKTMPAKTGTNHQKVVGFKPPNQDAPDQSGKDVAPVPLEGIRPRGAVGTAFFGVPNATPRPRQDGDDELRVPQHLPWGAWRVEKDRFQRPCRGVTRGSPP